MQPRQQLKAQALIDLSNRAKGGSLIYIGVWLAIALAFSLPSTHTVFFAVHTMILAVLCGFRLWHFRLPQHRKLANHAFHYPLLVGSILVSAAHWGVLSATILADPSLTHIRNPILITTAVMTFAGAGTLNISETLRTYYPAILLAPTALVIMVSPTTEGYTLIFIGMLAIIYINYSSRLSSDDYWSAVTNRILAEERAAKMEELSITDQLTQLKNRMFFDARFEEEWKRGLRQNTPLSVIMIDLDHFKQLNDCYGHLFGDDSLRAVAKALQSEIQRPTDCIARYGGEEFVVLLPDTDAEGAQTIAERFLQAIARLELKAEGRMIKITCSIGVSTSIPSYRERQDSLLQKADQALYQAKDHGRNQVYALSA